MEFLSMPYIFCGKDSRSVDRTARLALRNSLDLFSCSSLLKLCTNAQARREKNGKRPRQPVKASLSLRIHEQSRTHQMDLLPAPKTAMQHADNVRHRCSRTLDFLFCCFVVFASAVWNEISSFNGRERERERKRERDEKIPWDKQMGMGWNEKRGHPALRLSASGHRQWHQIIPHFYGGWPLSVTIRRMFFLSPVLPVSVGKSFLSPPCLLYGLQRYLWPFQRKRSFWEKKIAARKTFIRVPNALSLSSSLTFLDFLDKGSWRLWAGTALNKFVTFNQYLFIPAFLPWTVLESTPKLPS